MIGAWLLERVIHMRPFKGRLRLIRLLRRWTDGQFITSRYGVRMRIRAADLTNEAAVAGTFSRDYDDVYAEVAALEPGMAFIDVGANHGLFTLVAGQRVGPDGAVLAFEPDLESFHVLARNVAENQLPSTFLFNAAVSLKNGIEAFQPGPPSHSGIGRMAPDGSSQVMVMNFTDNMPLLGTLLGGRRAVIKIDVEGHEAHVVDALSDLLKGPQVEKLIVEIDEKHLARHGSTAAEIYDALAVAGFRAQRGPGAAPHYNDVFRRAGPSRSAQPRAARTAAP